MYAPDATALWVCLFDDEDGDRDPARADRAHPRHLARRAARRTSGTAVRLPRRRAVGPGARPALQPAQAAARPLRPRGQRRVRPRPGDLRLRGRRRPARHRRPARPRRARLGAVRRPRAWSSTTSSTGAATADRRALARHRHLRAARQGLHRAARPDPRGAARDVRRPRPPRWSPTTCATSASPPSSCCPTHQFVSEPALSKHGLSNYWGYNSIGFFAPHAAYSSSRRPRRAGARVQADGEELPRRRDRGDPRRRLQPHRRGGRGRADAAASAGSTTSASTSASLAEAGGRTRAGHLLGRHRLRQHRRRREPDGAAADPGLAALLGHRDARRRLPLRPDVGADAHRARRRHGRAAC